MQSHYFIKQIIEEVTNSFLSNAQEVCSCNICRKKMINILLQQLGNKYQFTDKDIPYTRVQGTDVQIKAEVIKELTLIIAANPRGFCANNVLGKTSRQHPCDT